MDPVHESSPWARSKVGVNGLMVHVLSSPVLVPSISVAAVAGSFFFVIV